jgi:hypothetical protein
VGTPRALLIALRGTLEEWLRLRWSDLQFTEAATAFFLVVVVLAVSLLMIAARRLWSPRARQTQLGLPAVLPVMRRSYVSATRHTAFLLFLLGVPFFAVALADPHTAFTQEQVSYPGRRIAILIDSSSSMVLKFNSAKLQAQGEPAFYTAVAAAERFLRLRMKGPYHDLIALIQFGNEAYVVTPFTTDYQNVLLSMKLVSNPKEWGRFSDWGTTIIQGLEQGTQLFKTFNFLNASGNLMLVFTDGRDDQATLKGQSLDDLVSLARRNKIPVYMIRTAFNMKFGSIAQDGLWKDAIERTGGRFYAAADEDAILSALSEIDRLTPGRIDVHQYTSQRPRFAGYALIAIALWLSAGTLKLGFRHFRTFP